MWSLISRTLSVDELYTNRKAIYIGTFNLLMFSHFLLDEIARYKVNDRTYHSCALNHNDECHQSEIPLLFDWSTQLRYST